METIQESAQIAIAAVGGTSVLAHKLLKRGHSKQEKINMQRRISWWKRKGVPSKWILQVEHISGVSRHRLSPELYPIEETA